MSMMVPEPQQGGGSLLERVMALAQLIEAELGADGLDAQERLVVEDIRTKLTKIAAGREQEREKALGVSAQMKAMARGGGL